MDKFLFRIVAALLVPALAGEPSTAAICTSLDWTYHASPITPSLFASQALVGGMVAARFGAGSPAKPVEVKVLQAEGAQALPRRTIIQGFAAAIGLAAKPTRALALFQEEPAQTPSQSQAISRELNFYLQDLSNQSKDLPSEIRTMMQSIINENVRIQPDDKTAQDVFKRTMKILEDDLFQAGYLLDWGMTAPVFASQRREVQCTFFDLKQTSRESVEINVKGETIRVDVYSKRVASGLNPHFWTGKAFPERRLALVDEDTISSERFRLLPGPAFMFDFYIDEQLGLLAEMGLSSDELLTITRRASVVHEVLHVYFHLLHPPGDNLSEQEINDYFRRNELASYLGELGMTSHPYVDLLFRLRDLKAGAGFGISIGGHAAESAEAIFRGLARDLGNQFASRKDRNFTKKIARGTERLRINEAAAFFEALLRNRKRVSEQDIRAAARKIYEEQFGSFVEDFKPVAHLFPGSAMQDVLVASAAQTIIHPQSILEPFLQMMRKWLNRRTFRPVIGSFGHYMIPTELLASMRNAHLEASYGEAGTMDRAIRLNALVKALDAAGSDVFFADVAALIQDYLQDPADKEKALRFVRNEENGAQQYAFKDALLRSRASQRFVEELWNPDDPDPLVNDRRKVQTNFADILEIAVLELLETDSLPYTERQLRKMFRKLRATLHTPGFKTDLLELYSERLDHFRSKDPGQIDHMRSAWKSGIEPASIVGDITRDIETTINQLGHAPPLPWRWRLKQWVPDRGTIVYIFLTLLLGGLEEVVFRNMVFGTDWPFLIKLLISGPLFVWLHPALNALARTGLVQNIYRRLGLNHEIEPEPWFGRITLIRFLLTGVFIEAFYSGWALPIFGQSVSANILVHIIFSALAISWNEWLRYREPFQRWRNITVPVMSVLQGGEENKKTGFGRAFNVALVSLLIETQILFHLLPPLLLLAPGDWSSELFSSWISPFFFGAGFLLMRLLEPRRYGLRPSVRDPALWREISVVMLLGALVPFLGQSTWLFGLVASITLAILVSFRERYLWSRYQQPTEPVMVQSKSLLWRRNFWEPVAGALAAGVIAKAASKAIDRKEHVVPISLDLLRTGMTIDCESQSLGVLTSYVRMISGGAILTIDNNFGSWFIEKGRNRLEVAPTGVMLLFGERTELVFHFKPFLGGVYSFHVEGIRPLDSQPIPEPPPRAAFEPRQNRAAFRVAA